MHQTGIFQTLHQPPKRDATQYVREKKLWNSVILFSAKLSYRFVLPRKPPIFSFLPSRAKNSFGRKQNKYPLLSPKEHPLSTALPNHFPIRRPWWRRMHFPRAHNVPLNLAVTRIGHSLVFPPKRFHPRILYVGLRALLRLRVYFVHFSFHSISLIREREKRLSFPASSFFLSAGSSSELRSALSVAMA